MLIKRHPGILLLALTLALEIGATTTPGLRTAASNPALAGITRSPQTALAHPLDTSNACTWYVVSSTAPGVDFAAAYLRFDFYADPSVAFTVTGSFPAARYSSFAVYTNSNAVITNIDDVSFPADPGALNPFATGGRRGAGTYTLRVVNASPPVSPTAGTLYTSAPYSTPVTLWYRLYLHDSAADTSSNAGLPIITPYRVADGSPISCAIQTYGTYIGVSNTPPVPRNTFIHWAAGVFPNPDSQYLATHLLITNTLYLVRFKAPTTPRTLAGEPLDLSTQVRYYSICIGSSVANSVTPTTSCQFDENMPLDANGMATIVMGPTGTQPPNATAANNVQWFDMGPLSVTAPLTTLVLIRYLLPSPSFTQSPAGVPIGAAVSAAVMGPYAPMVTTCSTAQFQATMCVAPTATPSATATAVAPLSPTPTGTPIAVPTNTAVPTATPQARITLSLAYGVVAQPLTLTLSGFAPSEQVSVASDALPSASVPYTMSATGAITRAVKVPPLPYGKRTITATGSASGRSASATFYMFPHLFPESRFIAGGPAVVIGYGFGASESVTAHWGSQNGAPVGSATTDATGSFPLAAPLTVTVPLSPAGSYPLIVQGVTSGALVTQTVTITPFVQTTPSSVAPGGQVRVGGSGYAAGETITLYGGCSAAPCSGARLLGTTLSDSRGVPTPLTVTVPTTVGVGSSYAIGGLGASGSFAGRTVTISGAMGGQMPFATRPHRARSMQ